MRFFTSPCALFCTLFLAAPLCLAGQLEDAAAPLKAGRAKQAEASPQPANEEIQSLIDHGDYRAALDAANRLIAKSPRDSEAYRLRANARRNLGDLAGSLEDSNKAVELDPSNARALGGRSIVKRMLKDAPGALADVDRALTLNPAYHQGYDSRALLRLEAGELAGSLADANRAIELSPQTTSYLLRRAITRKAMKDPAAAAADLSRAIEINPKERAALSQRSTLRSDSGDLAGALDDLNRAIQIDPANNSYLLRRAALQRSLKDLAGADQGLTKAVELNPQQAPSGVAVAVPPDLIAREKQALKALLAHDLPDTRARLAAVRHAHAFAILDKAQTEPGKKALEEAVAYAKSATVLEPGNANYWFQTGLLFRKLAALDERAAAMAEQALRQAVEVDPEHAASWLELGLMMAAQERAREAMTALERALENDPARTASAATGLLCAMYALNDEGFRGIDFFQELYASNPEVSGLGVGAAIMFDYLGDREAALEQARDVMHIEEAGTPEHAYAAKLVNEWEGKKP